MAEDHHEKLEATIGHCQPLLPIIKHQSVTPSQESPQQHCLTTQHGLVPAFELCVVTGTRYLWVLVGFHSDLSSTTAQILDLCWVISVFEMAMLPKTIQRLGFLVFPHPFGWCTIPLPPKAELSAIPQVCLWVRRCFDVLQLGDAQGSLPTFNAGEPSMRVNLWEFAKLVDTQPVGVPERKSMDCLGCEAMGGRNDRGCLLGFNYPVGYLFYNQ